MPKTALIQFYHTNDRHKNWTRSMSSQASPSAFQERLDRIRANRPRIEAQIDEGRLPGGNSPPLRERLSDLRGIWSTSEKPRQWFAAHGKMVAIGLITLWVLYDNPGIMSSDPVNLMARTPAMSIATDSFSADGVNIEVPGYLCMAFGAGCN